MTKMSEAQEKKWEEVPSHFRPERLTEGNLRVLWQPEGQGPFHPSLSWNRASFLAPSLVTETR